MSTRGLFLAPCLVTQCWRCVLVHLDPRGEVGVSLRLVKVGDLHHAPLESRLWMMEGQLA